MKVKSVGACEQEVASKQIHGILLDVIALVVQVRFAHPKVNQSDFVKIFVVEISYQYVVRLEVIEDISTLVDCFELFYKLQAYLYGCFLGERLIALLKIIIQSFSEFFLYNIRPYFVFIFIEHGAGICVFATR